MRTKEFYQNEERSIRKYWTEKGFTGPELEQKVAEVIRNNRRKESKIIDISQ